MSKRIGYRVITAAFAVLSMASSAYGSDRRDAFTSFLEDPKVPLASSGASARWTDTQWGGMICPPHGVNSIVTGLLSSMYQPSVFVQIGSVREKWKSGGNCMSSYRYFWEWVTPQDLKQGTIGGAPPANHKHSLTYGPEGCANGPLCWHFKMDGSTQHRCCAVLEHNVAAYATVQTECIWHGGDTGCPGGSGLVDRYNLKIKLIDNEDDQSWEDWRGRDRACVNYGKHARGKWNSGTSAVGGFNVSMNNSISGCVDGPGIE